jgi:hypothetical protein
MRPRCASERTSEAWAAAFWPMLKNVAVIPAELRIDSILAVLLPGPSSKVSATVLPPPGAAEYTPYGAAGHPVEICGEVTLGGEATRPFGISAGGPAGPSFGGDGDGDGLAAAWAGITSTAGTATPAATARPRAAATENLLPQANMSMPP